MPLSEPAPRFDVANDGGNWWLRGYGPRDAENDRGFVVIEFHWHEMGDVWLVETRDEIAVIKDGWQ